MLLVVSIAVGQRRRVFVVFDKGETNVGSVQERHGDVRV
jgi:hypothetical protein